MNEVVQLERHGDIAIVTINSPPVNALSAAVRGGIFECMKSAIADAEVKAIVLTSAGRTFIAGADITEFGKPPKPPGLQEALAMIISGGFNVYPQMIEQAIYTHPAVHDVLVIGIPDDYRGEAAKAFVTLKPNATAFALEDLRAFLTGKLGKHELPAALEFVAELPRTAVGKLSRHELRTHQPTHPSGQLQLATGGRSCHRLQHRAPQRGRGAGCGFDQALRQDRYPGLQRGGQSVLRPAARHYRRSLRQDHVGTPVDVRSNSSQDERPAHEKSLPLKGN